MNIQEKAKQIAIKNNMPRAEKYDMMYRSYDDMVEILGYVQDPTYDMKDFEGREMLFPKRWITIGIVEADQEVAA